MISVFLHATFPIPTVNNNVDKMNTLDFCLSLREKGLDAVAIKKKMQEKGFKDSEISYYLKKSDDIFLNQLIQKKRIKPGKKRGNLIKIIALVFSLLLLIGVLLGYLRISILGLFIVWGIVGYSSYRK
jgi:hypothetical protein